MNRYAALKSELTAARYASRNQIAGRRDQMLVEVLTAAAFIGLWTIGSRADGL